MRLVDIDDIRVMKFLSEEDDPSESDGEREYRNGWNDALTAINDIQPSAEPTEASCWGCNCPKMERLAETHDKRTETHSCDTISRQNAIDALHYWFADGFEEDRWWNSTHVLAALEGLPSAEPETCEGCKHLGKWENEVEYGYPSPCTRCKRRVEDRYER